MLQTVKIQDKKQLQQLSDLEAKGIPFSAAAEAALGVS